MVLSCVFVMPSETPIESEQQSIIQWGVQKPAQKMHNNEIREMQNAQGEQYGR